VRTSRKNNTGAMIQRVDVQTATTDESSGQPIRTWATTYANEPAQWTPMAGMETIRGRQVEAGVAGYFTVNYRDGYSVEQRVLFNGLTFGVVHVKSVDGGRRYIELHVKAEPE